MIKITTVLKRASLVAALFCVSIGAHAALVNFQLSGDVQAAVGNPYGLSVGDTILATGTFDDSVLVGGSGTISFADSINNMSIYVGDTTYTDLSIVGDAQLTLSASAFVGLDFTSTDNGSFVSIVGSFVGGNNNLAGSWDAASLQMSPVPVPAAAWLMGSGLVALAGFVRCKRK